MKRLVRLAFLIPIVCLVLLAGCSSGATVHGEVTLDGQPLKQGVIRFVPVDGRTPPTEAPITDGKYTASAPPGNMRIEISAPKVAGKIKMYETPDAPLIDNVVESLPARYNVSSDLKMTVQAGRQEKRFDLTSK